jgi:hypothetical protein
MAVLLSAIFSLLLTQAAPNWLVAVDPTTAHATNVHWTFSLSAGYCGGYQIGNGVFIQPEAPLSLPDPVPPDAVLFAGQPADVSMQSGVLRVAPAPGLVRSQICLQGQRPFTIELLPSLGLSNPDSGAYLVDVWTGSDPTVQQLPLTVDDPSASDDGSAN